MKPIIIIQARENSKRLDKKILKKVLNKTLLEIMYGRIKHLQKKFKIIFAIPKNNSKLKNEILKFQGNIFEGDENDVLSRFYNCAKENNLSNDSVIIRLTSDCPLIDKDLINNFIIFFIKIIMIIHQILLPTYPDGLDVEILSFLNLRFFNSKVKTW